MSNPTDGNSEGELTQKLNRLIHCQKMIDFGGEDWSKYSDELINLQAEIERDYLPSNRVKQVNVTPQVRQQIDDIVFRCFVQGQHWGTEQNGKLNDDYKPENPIDRTEATKVILDVLDKYYIPRTELEKAVVEARKETVLHFRQVAQFQKDRGNGCDRIIGETKIMAKKGWKDDGYRDE